MECYEKGLITKEDTGGIDLRFGNGDAMIAMVDKIARREGIGDILAEDLATAASQDRRRRGDVCRAQSKARPTPCTSPGSSAGWPSAMPSRPRGRTIAMRCTTRACRLPTRMALTPMAVAKHGHARASTLESLGPDKVRATIYSTH